MPNELTNNPTDNINDVIHRIIEIQEQMCSHVGQLKTMTRLLGEQVDTLQAHLLLPKNNAEISMCMTCKHMLGYLRTLTDSKGKLPSFKFKSLNDTCKACSLQPDFMYKVGLLSYMLAANAALLSGMSEINSTSLSCLINTLQAVDDTDV